MASAIFAPPYAHTRPARRHRRRGPCAGMTTGRFGACLLRVRNISGIRVAKICPHGRREPEGNAVGQVPGRPDFQPVARANVVASSGQVSLAFPGSVLAAASGSGAYRRRDSAGSWVGVSRTSAVPRAPVPNPVSRHPSLLDGWANCSHPRTRFVRDPGAAMPGSDHQWPHGRRGRCAFPIRAGRGIAALVG